MRPEVRGPLKDADFHPIRTVNNSRRNAPSSIKTRREKTWRQAFVDEFPSPPCFDYSLLDALSTERRITGLKLSRHSAESRPRRSAIGERREESASVWVLVSCCPKIIQRKLWFTSRQVAKSFEKSNLSGGNASASIVAVNFPRDEQNVVAEKSRGVWRAGKLRAVGRDSCSRITFARRQGEGKDNSSKREEILLSVSRGTGTSFGGIARIKNLSSLGRCGDLSGTCCLLDIFQGRGEREGTHDTNVGRH